MTMVPFVLSVDLSGLPQAWIPIEEAITYHARNRVAWSLGSSVAIFHGGWNSRGQRSEIETCSIIAIKGSARRIHSLHPRLTNPLLFSRDRQICAYCGHNYPIRELSRDHIIPVSRGGRNVWTNVVTACRRCNISKANRTLEEAGLKLLYVPYAPNRHEHFILGNRRILADQMEYLLSGVPATSRLHG
jgi:5-methylcytosine-specific restriction endonuclease McrA